MGRFSMNCHGPSKSLLLYFFEYEALNYISNTLLNFVFCISFTIRVITDCDQFLTIDFVSSTPALVTIT